MCGRFALSKTSDEIESEVASAGWEDKRNYLPNFNIAPTQSSPVLLNEGNLRVQLMRWGLIPSWAKDNSRASKMINARFETLTERPAFRGLLAARRCVVLADGYYEWKREGSQKQPYFISSADGTLLRLAGLWDLWRSAAHGVVHSFTIITRTPFKNISHIHDRMPAVIGRRDQDAWLEKGAQATAAAFASVESSAVKLKAYPVATIVNSVRNNSPECIRPLDVPLKPL